MLKRHGQHFDERMAFRCLFSRSQCLYTFGPVQNLYTERARWRETERARDCRKVVGGDYYIVTLCQINVHTNVSECVFSWEKADLNAQDC